jgi:hypothetical protein
VQAQISPEVDLLVACAHPSLDSKTTQRIQTLSQGLIDWDNLIQLATVHRTLGLLYRNLNHCCPQSVPIQTRTYLEEQYYYTAGYNSFLANSLVNTLKPSAASPCAIRVTSTSWFDQRTWTRRGKYFSRRDSSRSSKTNAKTT